MKLYLTTLLLISLTVTANAAIFMTNSPDADAFVRAAAPTLNYGAAGALSVSGPNGTNSSGVTNGAFDSFIRFNTGAMVSNFNAAFGTNNWVITSATLNLTENANPGNAIFNIGTGAFEIRWIANDNWTEGTGSPMATVTNGITYSEEPSLLNSNTDVNLGIFTNAGNAKLSCALPLPTAFVTNMQAGGEVGLFMTAIDSAVGYVFYSINFAGNASSHPALVVSAVAQPGLTGTTLAGPNLLLSATNGVAGGTYYVLTSTNLTSPPSQWTPVATNVLAASGNFAITVTNGVNTKAQNFFILQTQ